MVAAAQWYLIWLFARHAGPQAVGVYSSLIAFMTPIFIIAQFGLRNLYVTLQTSVRWPVYVAIRAAGIILASALAFAGLTFLMPDAAWPMGVCILIIKTANSVADLYFARLQRVERLRTFGLLLIFDAGFTAAATTVVIALTGSIELAVLGAAIIAVASAGATMLLAHRTTGAPDGGRTASAHDDALLLLRHGSPLALSQGIQSVLTYLPIAIVGSLGTAADVGVYSSAAYLVTFANLLGASIQTAVLSDLRRRFETSGASTLRQAIRSNTMVTFLALTPLVVLAVVVGPHLLTFVYGPAFEISRASVLLLSIAAVIVLPTYLLSSYHLVLNRYWVMTMVGAGSVIIVVIVGALAALVGLGPVEAGCLAVLAAAAARFVGAAALSRSGVSENPTPERQRAEL